MGAHIDRTVKEAFCLLKEDEWRFGVKIHPNGRHNKRE